jgi:hypothetical protein
MVGALVLGVCGSSGLALAADGPQVPPGLEVPADNVAYLRGYAEGTQNYICIAGPSGMRWQFTGPQATLFLTFQDYPWQQISTHFLSPNPAEAGTPRATWQHSIDTSRVWGRAIASSIDPTYVAEGAIPWLLLEAVGSSVGPLRGRTLTATTFIQRVNTSGGLAPATGCTEPAHEGAAALVPYSTDYIFYRRR